MPKLWIANTTKQIHTFCYRPKIGAGGKSAEDGILRPVFGEMRQQSIPVGGQICVGGADGISDEEIKVILNQHKHIVEFKDLNRVKGFQGMCYRIGSDPVPIGEIMERIETNDEVRTQQNEDRQTATTLGIAENMRAVSQTSNAPFQDLRETNVQIAEQGSKGVNEGTPRLNRVVEVAEEGKEPSGRGRKNAA